MLLGLIPIPASALGSMVALLAVVAFAAFCVRRFAAGRLAAFGPGRGPLVLAACGIGLLAFGVRLTLAEGHVSWAPYLDQWGAEIGGVVAPLAHGSLGWRDMVAGNNEHRVFLTRAISLAAIEINGCWDNRALVIVNYLLESAIIAWVSALAWSFLGWLRGSYVAAAALLPMFLVCDWESIMWSNQTQFVAMAFCSVLALTLTESRSLRSLQAWGALAVALLTLGSMASGFLAAVAMAATAALTAFVNRQEWRTVIGYCSACVAIAAFGWLTRDHFELLFFLYAKDFGDWLHAFLAYAAWPLPAGVAGFLGLWLPWIILLGLTLRRRAMHPFAPFALGLGLWALLQGCAIAWARAGLSSVVSSRYVEFLWWGVVANAVAIVLVLGGPGSAGKLRAASFALLGVWLAGVGACEIRMSIRVHRPYYEQYRGYTVEHEQRLGDFMRSGDANVIEGVRFPRIPHYNPDLIVALLRDPGVQALLPGPMRRDLMRDRRPSLLPSIQDGTLSTLAVFALRNGLWFAAAGAALIIGAAYRALRSGARAHQVPR